MADSLSIGDTARVEIDDYGTPLIANLIVRSIRPDQIIATQGYSVWTLIPTSRGWQSAGLLDHPHTITFIPREVEITPALTGIYDTDLYLLSQLDLDTLSNLCQTNQYINRFCQSEDFWRHKVVQEFGPQVAQYKPEEHLHHSMKDHLQIHRDMVFEILLNSRYASGIQNNHRGLLVDVFQQSTNSFY
jgi:hypothetical protein